MVKVTKLYFFLIQFLVVLFWGLPELVQKPLKIGVLVFFMYLFCVLVYNKLIDYKKIFVLSAIVLMGVLISLNGAFQTSLVNVVLSAFAIVCLPLMYRPFTKRELKISKIIGLLVCASMALQLLYFRTEDGRPSLSYEINWGAAYLFIFFLYSDFIKFRIGKLFVILASLAILSRLLLMCIILFYTIRYVKKISFFANLRIKWGYVLFLTYLSFFLFNGWYLLNVETDETYDASISRVGNINDGSNKLRFLVNITFLGGMADGDSKLIFGYGQISRGVNAEFAEKYFLMPHNELLDSIAEFGYIFTLLFLFFSYSYSKKLFTYYNYEYMVPILLYTLILWARFLIVPSLEMFFLFSIMGCNLRTIEQENEEENLIISE